MSTLTKPVKITLIVIVIALIIGAIYFFTRSGNDKPVARLVEMTLPGDNQIINGNVEVATIESSMWSDLLLIKGWACKLNVKEKNRELFLVLKSKSSTLVFDLDQDNVPRPDVTKYFKMDGSVNNHGYEGYIPMKLLTDSLYQIGFLIKDQSGQNFAMSQKELAFSGGTVKIENSKNVTNQVALPIQASNTPVKYFFEQFEVTGNALSISGWAFLQGFDTENLKTYIVLKSENKSLVFSAINQIRNDVTAFHKALGLNIDNSGFSIKINGDNLEAGRYEVCVYLVRDSQVGITYTGKFFEIKK